MMKNIFFVFCLFGLLAFQKESFASPKQEPSKEALPKPTKWIPFLNPNRWVPTKKFDAIE